MRWIGKLGWCVAGLIAVALHVALFAASPSRIRGEASTSAGPTVESASSLAGIVGQLAEVTPVETVEVAETPAATVTEAQPVTTSENLESEDLSPTVTPSTVSPPIDTRTATASPALAQIVVPETAISETLVPELAEQVMPPDVIEALAPPPQPEVTQPRKRRAQKPRRTKPEQKTAKQPRRAQRAPAKRKRPAKERKSRPAKARRRGNSARGSAGARAGGGRSRSTASQGAINAYASRVRSRILARSPSGKGARGTTVISFALRSSGALRYARIVRSSGNRRLDRRALAAVRGGGFPRPPKGASARQLRFTIPFHFR